MNELFAEENEKLDNERVKLKNKLKVNKAKKESLQRVQSDMYYNDNKGKFNVLTIIAVASIILNIFAVVMTGILVQKTVPEGHEIVYHEANPIMATINNFQTDYRAQIQYIGSMFNWIIYAFILWFNFYGRREVTNHKEFAAFAFAFIALGVLWGLDFFNDLGIMIGKLIFTGGI